MSNNVGQGTLTQVLLNLFNGCSYPAHPGVAGFFFNDFKLANFQSLVNIKAPRLIIILYLQFLSYFLNREGRAPLLAKHDQEARRHIHE